MKIYVIHQTNILLCVLVGSLTLAVHQENTEANTYEVIVVGCGAAGLAALGRLEENGVRALCLEAESRVGGRINTQRYGSGVAEFGAEWIHGETNNVLIELTRSNNITIPIPPEMDITFYLSNGSRPNKEKCDKMAGYMFSVVEDVPQEPVLTMQTYLNEKLKEYIDENPTMQRESKFWNLFMSWFSKSASAYNGVDNYGDISTKGLSDYRDCAGPPNFSWGSMGYETLFDILLEKSDDNSSELIVDIQLNKEVVRIDWFPDKLTNQVAVECADGSVYRAKAAIITMSVGVLQERSKSLFNPALPPAKQRSIDLIELGSITKMLLRYDQVWWEDFSFLAFIWDDLDVTQLLDEDKWLAKLFGATISEGSPNVLTFWLTGEAARQVEAMPLELLQQKLDWVVVKFCQSHHPGIPPSSELRRTMWYSNSHFRGSYSYHGLKSDGVEDPTRALRESIHHRRSDAPLLMFAGEATHQHYFSTVHGAVETGWREADRVLAWRNMKGNDAYRERESALARKGGT